jgi:4-amino-4-deoxy-L-arabinose transferase-like glycosyltransferase
VLLLLEGGLYRQYVLREVAPLPPIGGDQTVYLLKSYRIHQSFHEQGLFLGLVKAFQEPSPNGLLHPIAAALGYFLLGPSRLSALTVNFLAFALFEVVLAYYLLWRTRRWAVVFLGLGLLLTAATINQRLGGLLDFRFDFPVMCLYGVFLCLVLRSRIFLLRKWAVAAAAAAAALVLYRFFTGAYLAGMAFLFALWCGWQWLRLRSSPESRQQARQRSTGLVLVVLIVAVLCLPVVILQFRPLWDYYGVNHLLGGDRDIRAREFGVETTWAALTFYPRSLYQQHTGHLFVALGVAALLACLVLGLWRRNSTTRPERSDQRASAVCLTLALLVPLLLLTLGVSKSPVVGGIFVPPLLCLVLLPAIGLADRLPGSADLSSRLFGGLAGVALACGVATLLAAQVRPHVPECPDPQGKQLLALYNAIDHSIEEHGLTSPVLGADMINGFLCGPAVDVTLFEHSGQFRNIGHSISTTVMAVNEADVLAQARQSDFVIVTDIPEVSGGGFDYPFHDSMIKIRPRLREMCDREFLFLGEFQIMGAPRRLYERPRVTVQSRYPDWVDREGLTIKGRSAVLHRFPVVQLTGAYLPRLLKGKLQATAWLESGAEVPAVVQEGPGESYHLMLRLDQAPVGERDVTVRVRFDQWFVPRDLGINPDPRQLTVRKPHEVRLGAVP